MRDWARGTGAQSFLLPTCPPAFTTRCVAGAKELSSVAGKARPFWYASNAQRKWK
jgi:hypothetical protein